MRPGRTNSLHLHRPTSTLQPKVDGVCEFAGSFGCGVRAHGCRGKDQAMRGFCRDSVHSSYTPLRDAWWLSIVVVRLVSSIPSNSPLFQHYYYRAWWGLNVTGFAISEGLGEVLCMRREMQEIPVAAGNRSSQADV